MLPMGTITERRRKDGSPTYLAQIKARREGVVYRENKTFTRRAMAESWIAKREKEIASGLAVPIASDPPLAEAIARYVNESKRAIGRTKEQCLRSLAAMPIANRRCSSIASHDLLDLARELSAGRGASTVSNYMSHLAAIFAVAKPAWGIPLDRSAMTDALTVARRLGIVGKALKRERRPTIEEIGQLLSLFEDRNRRRPSSTPMGRIIVFALYSTRRLEEITRITWDDYENDRVMVRDMKNPGDKIGNNVWCDLPPEAVAVIESMTRVDDRIFPYSGDAIGAAFTRACKRLGIEDLHFHDLRHEGISRLCELGWSIPRVAAVSGHRSWSSLKIYAHLRHKGDRWADVGLVARVTRCREPT